MKKKLLTIDDLVKFCEEKKFSYFNAQDEGYSLSVQIPSVYEISEGSDDDRRGLMKLKIKVFHTGLNRNGSFISEESAKAAMSSIKNRPVLAHIHQLDDGEWDFEGHNLEISEDENGNEKITYIERQVGSFSEAEPFFEEDEETGKQFVCAYAYIPEEYTKAAEILRRKNGSKNSCELSIDEFSYDAKEHHLNLKAFYVSASTLLGSRSSGKAIKEGMLGSRADIVDFSSQNNSVISTNNEVLEQMSQLDDKINKLIEFAINNTKKGGKDMPKFEELLAKFNKTTEDITFDYEVMTDEELIAAFEEAFGQNEGGGETGVNPIVSKYSIILSNGTTATFDVSLDEIQSAMCSLVNDTYSEQDNAWYSVKVYDNYVVMSDYWSHKNYKQIYSRENDEFSLTGERVEVFANFLTKEEEEQLADMRANYSVISDKLNKYEEAELDAQKDAIFADEAYSKYLEIDEFKTLKENKGQYSLEDLKKEAELAFSKCVRKLGFSLTDETPASAPSQTGIKHKKFTSSKETENASPYGTLKFD